jgi:signal transduction histidine kinase
MKIQSFSKAETKDPDFKLIFESSPGLYLILTPSLEIVAVSEAYLHATMTQRDAILGRHLFDVFPDNPDEIAATGISNLRKSLDRVLKQKVADTMAIQKYDIRKPASEGGEFEVRYWSPTNSPVFDCNQNICYIIHRVEDVTEFLKLLHKDEHDRVNDYKERMEIEILERNNDLRVARENLESAHQKLMLSNSLINGILESIDNVIVAYDLDGNLIHSNTAFEVEYERAFGRKLTYGMNIIQDLAHLPEDQKKIIDAHNRLLKKGKHSVIEEYGDDKCERQYYDINYNLLKNEKGGNIGIIHTAKNITERVKEQKALKKSEEALRRANQELESFSYSVSHDLRAPLRAIDGFSKILQDKYQEQLPSEAKHFLSMVRDSARDMGQLIDDLLAFSRFGRQELVKQTFSMTDLVNEVIDKLKIDEKNKDRNIQITVENLPDSEGDRALLKQVVYNLLANAFKFTKNSARPMIRIGVNLQDDVPVYYIEDNGAGFDMRYVKKLFGVFQRLHRAEEYEGTGVGLAIVERIITRHGGKVWAKSEPGKGAIFYFTLGKEHDLYCETN